MNTRKNVIYILFLVALIFAFSTCVNNFMGSDEGIIQSILAVPA